jgi:hypothetical protein
MSGCSSGYWRRCSASSGSRWFTASRWGRSRPSIGPHFSLTGSSGSRRFAVSAKTSPHNFVFFEGVKAPLIADPAWQDGWFAAPPTRGFQAMGRVYAGWGLSQAFYREEIWRKIGFSSWRTSERPLPLEASKQRGRVDSCRSFRGPAKAEAFCIDAPLFLIA